MNWDLRIKRLFLPCVFHTDETVGIKVQCGRENVACWRTAANLGVTKVKWASWSGEWQELSIGVTDSPRGNITLSWSLLSFLLMTVLVMRNTIFPTLSWVKSSTSSDFTLGNVAIVSELARILCLPVQCIEVTFYSANKLSRSICEVQGILFAVDVNTETGNGFCLSGSLQLTKQTWTFKSLLMEVKIIAKAKRKGLFLTTLESREIYLEDGSLWLRTEGPKEMWQVDSGVKVGPGLERGARWRPAQDHRYVEFPWDIAQRLESLSLGLLLAVKRNRAKTWLSRDSEYLTCCTEEFDFIPSFCEQVSAGLLSIPGHHCL